MTRHLLALSLGPVQDFIAAARRTRDLWFGSFLLSEVSKAAAGALADRGGLESLIFPALENLPELNDRRFNCANVILALLPEGIDPASCASEARQKASQRWRKFSDEAAQLAGNLIEDEIWKDQVDDVLEFYAAWVPLRSVQAYSEDRRRLMRLLAARKACRDFKPARGRAHVPKSSLDGARETVLRRGTKGSSRLPLAAGEQVDAVGLTKRIAGGQVPYPSVARVAASSWLKITADSPAEAEGFLELKRECERLAEDGILSRVAGPAFEAFPYEGTAVYLSRHQSLAEEAGKNKTDLQRLSDLVRQLTLKDGLGEPSPYLAILMADGDSMGATLSRLPSPEAHREFSKSLSSFAAQARKVTAEAGGVCIYAGGDDVLALSPLNTALDCARQLHDWFESLLTGAGGLEHPPTLSVGVAVGHFMKPLEDLRDYARNAEKSAKQRSGLSTDMRFGERNGLAVHVHVRSGASLQVRERWQPGEDSLDRRLERWRGLFASKQLPAKLPYDFRQLVSEYQHWPSGEALRVALGADARRVAGRKQLNLEDDLGWFQDRLGSLQSAKDLERLADEMLIAQWLAGVGGTAETPSGSEEVPA